MKDKEKIDPKDVIKDEMNHLEHLAMIQEIKNRMTEKINENNPQFMNIIKTLIEDDEKTVKF